MANTVQPDYHYHLKTASHPAISPNDKAVAFTVHRFESGSHKAITDIFVKSLGSSSILTQITNSGTATKPAWSVDSKKIAYLDEDDSGVKQIFVRVAAGGDPKPITDQIANVDAMAWSPDGSKIAFRALVPGPDELAVLNADPELPNIRTARRIRYQQDGVGWRGDSFYHLFVYDFDTKATSQITDSSTGPGDDGPPVWSPDGLKIAFISDRHPDRETSSNTELYVCNADGSSLEQWPGDMFMVESIAWSPDSKRIAVTGGRTKSEVGGYGLTTQSSIFVLEQGSDPIKLTDDSIRPHANGAGFPITADSPFMSWPDSGDGIVFGADSKGQSHVAIANPESPGDVRLVTMDPQVMNDLFPRQRSILERLTQNQMEALMFISSGYADSAISEELNIDEDLVEPLLQTIYEDLHLEDSESVDQRVQATLLYLQETAQVSS